MNPKTPRKKLEIINMPIRLRLARPLLARPRAVAVIPIPVSNIDGTIAVVAGM